MNGQKTVIHQYHHTAAPADAISNQMRFIQRSLQEVDIKGSIFATEIQKGADDFAEKFHPHAFWDADLVLLHHSQGNPELHRVLHAEIPKALVYHNITPPDFFRHDPVIADLCRLGRAQLQDLKGAVVKAFTVSEFNASELEAMGFEDIDILPLLDLSVETKPSPKRKLKEGPLLLFVGRIARHKNQASLIKVLYYLCQSLESARLVFVGRGDPLYSLYLRSLTQILGIERHVHFSGKTSEEQLHQWYAKADAFVCASLHEGFCIPLVEAMQAGVPVFYGSKTGVAETMRNAGVRFSSDDPQSMAETLLTHLNNTKALDAAVASQELRLRQLGKTSNRRVVQQLLTELVHCLRLTPGLLPTFPRSVHAPQEAH